MTKADITVLFLLIIETSIVIYLLYLKHKEKDFDKYINEHGIFTRAAQSLLAVCPSLIIAIIVVQEVFNGNS